MELGCEDSLLLGWNDTSLHNLDILQVSLYLPCFVFSVDFDIDCLRPRVSHSLRSIVFLSKGMQNLFHTHSSHRTDIIYSIPARDFTKHRGELVVTTRHQLKEMNSN